MSGITHRVAHVAHRARRLKSASRPNSPGSFRVASARKRTTCAHAAEPGSAMLLAQPTTSLKICFADFSAICSGAPRDGAIRRSDSVSFGRGVNEGKFCTPEPGVSAFAIRPINWAGGELSSGALAYSDGSSNPADGLAGQILYTSIKTDIQHPHTGYNVRFCDLRCQAAFDARNALINAIATGSACSTAARIFGSSEGVLVAASTWSFKSYVNSLRRATVSLASHADKIQVIRTPSGEGSAGSETLVSSMGVDYSTSDKLRHASTVAIENAHIAGYAQFAQAWNFAPEMGAFAHRAAFRRTTEAREGGSHTPNWPGRFLRAARSLWLCRPSNVRRAFHGRDYGAAPMRPRVAKAAIVQATAHPSKTEVL